MTDVLIRGGTVIDGTGRAPFRSDVVLRDGRVRLVREAAHDPAATVVDASGAVVAPGLIDAHSHADIAARYAEEAPDIHHCRLLQGVTTEVVGNCGFSTFPVPNSASQRVLSDSSAPFGAKGTTYETMAGYAQAMQRLPLPSNIAPLVGHGALRSAVLGADDRPADQRERDAMLRALRTALRQGAFGLSTGLAYTPGCWASHDELGLLASEVAAAGALYVSHIRSITDGVFEAVDEAVEVAAQASVALHISHLKLAGEANWGRSAEVLAKLDQARDGGLSVTTDVYPYTAGSTRLLALLPPPLFTSGVPAALQALRDPAVRRQVEAQLAAGVPGWQNLGTTTGWHNVRIASATGTPQHHGRSITDVAARLGLTSPVDAIAELLHHNDGQVVVVLHNMSEQDLTTFMRWPHTSIGSDGIPLPGLPHPRVAGTFPRVLGRYAGSGPGLDLPEMVRRMTLATAKRIGIPGRGQLSDGMVADVVVFDPDTVHDNATYEDPLLPPTGIRHVFVAGAAAVEDGVVVNDRRGRVLRRNEVHDRAS